MSQDMKYELESQPHNGGHQAKEPSNSIISIWSPYMQCLHKLQLC